MTWRMEVNSGRVLADRMASYILICGGPVVHRGTGQCSQNCQRHPRGCHAAGWVLWPATCRLNAITKFYNFN